MSKRLPGIGNNCIGETPTSHHIRKDSLSMLGPGTGGNTIGGSMDQPPHSPQPEEAVIVDEIPAKFDTSIQMTDVTYDGDKDRSDTSSEQTEKTNTAIDSICSQIIMPTDVLGIDFVDSKYIPKPPAKRRKNKDEKNNNVVLFQESAYLCYTTYFSTIVRFIVFLVFLGYTIYFIFALIHSIEGAKVLIILTCIAVVLFVYTRIRDRFGSQIYRNIYMPVYGFHRRLWPCSKWIIVPAVAIAMICYLSLGVIKEVRQLQSVSGFIVLTAYLILTSKHPGKINWRTVAWGFSLQFAFGILVLRWKPGYDAVKWLSDQIVTFINYSLEGAAVVFGNPTLLLHPLVFVSMPMLIYVGAVMSIMYQIGLTQLIAGKMGWFMQITMGTTAIESLAVAASIFLNGMDTVLMVRKYIPRLTFSEFHCFLVGNHATVAGFAFPLFVMFGAPPQYLLSAAVMSAPATMAVSKINWPETEESNTKTSKDLKMEDSDEMNLIEAASSGAALAGKTVASFVCNYIAFVGLLAFINASLSWIGDNVGYPELSFEVICSYLFFPLSMIIGVDLADCREVSKLIGIKIFASEILAYQELGNSVDTVGLSDRSVSIATYALCGFSSVSTVAIAVGVWQSVCPERVGDMARQLARVAINANISCFLTACVAGLLYDPSISIATDEGGLGGLVTTLLGLIPGYKDLWDLVF